MVARGNVMEQGARLPAVTLAGADGPIALDRLEGPVVLYFYPKDDTSGCTREAQDFSALAADFAAAGTRVIGVSRDPLSSHARFVLKHELAVELASDVDGSVAAAFGTWIEKSMYGRRYMGMERATFLFGRDGTLVRVWRKVRVAGHAADVLEAARAS